MSQTGDIKLAIRDKLQELVTAQTLGEVIVLSKPVSIFNINADNFPAAVLANSSFDGQRDTNQSNEVTHTFEVLIIEKAENITTDTYLEDLSETIRKKFAANETLGGKAMAIEPASSQVGPISETDYSMVIFLVTLKVRSIEQLI